MKPKEKALEIVKRMYEHTGWLAETKEGFDKQDVECALICVDETIQALKDNHDDSKCKVRFDYWEDVKEQITLL